MISVTYGVGRAWGRTGTGAGRTPGQPERVEVPGSLPTPHSQTHRSLCPRRLSESALIANIAEVVPALARICEPKIV